jgi:hypothetical protein
VSGPEASLDRFRLVEGDVKSAGRVDSVVIHAGGPELAAAVQLAVGAS